MDERSLRVERRLAGPVLIAALLTIPVIAIEGSSLGEPWRAIGTVLNWAAWLVFLAEIVIMLAVVPDRWQWLRTHPLEVIVTVLTPPVMPPGLQSLRALRLLRLLRLLRIGPLARRLFSEGGLRFAGFIALAVALGGAVAFQSAERGAHNNISFGDSLWWALTTMTTVGYGDLFPTTATGRLVGAAVMLIGIGVIALVTGAVAEQFLKRDVEEVEEAIEQEHQDAGEVAQELRQLKQQLDRLEALIARERG